MTSIVTKRDDPCREVVATVAYTTSLLGAYELPETPTAPWVELPRVRCPRLTLRCGGVDDAQLYERFSELGQSEPGEDGVAVTPWTDLAGKFVRVTVPLAEVDGGGAPDEEGDPPKPLVWYGYVPQGSRARTPTLAEEDDGMGGTVPVSRLAGVQQWRAVGLAWFLGRRQIDSAVVADRSAGAADGATRRIARPMTFNGGDASGSVDQNRPRGNKSLLTLSFTSPESVTDRWRALVTVATAFSEANSTIELVSDDLLPSNAAIRNFRSPDDFKIGSSEVPAEFPPVPNTIDQLATRISGLAGDLLRLVRNAADTLWDIDAAGSTEWTGESMLDYLLTRHGPADVAGDAAPCVFKLFAGGEVLRALKPTVPTEGRDVLSLIETIANRSRGVSYSFQTVTPDEDDALTAPEVRLSAYSLAGAAIGLPGGGSFPANPTAIELDIDDDPFRDAAVVSLNRESRYDQVRARGARVSSTFTVGFASGTLQRDWTLTAENAYHAAASGDEGYPAAEEEQRRVNDARRSELDLQRVYSAVRVPTDWDGSIPDAATPATRYDVFPRLDRDGDQVLIEPFTLEAYLPALRSLRRTRIPQPGAAADEFEAPFAVVRDGDDNWALAHALTDAASPYDERLASYRLARAEGGLAFRLYSSKGLSHTIAGGWEAASTYAAGVAYAAGAEVIHDSPLAGVFRRWRAPAAIATSADPFDSGEWTDLGPYTDPAPSRLEPEVDYRTLLITLAAEGDAFAEAVFGGTPVAGAALEELVIDAGSTYRLDLLIPDTVLGVAGGELTRQPDLEVLRDDRGALEQIAAMAYAWYKQPTQAIRVRVRRPYHRVHLGDYITSVGRAGSSDPVGTVVTEIDLDLGDGQTTTIATSGVEEAGIGAVAPQERRG